MSALGLIFFEQTVSEAEGISWASCVKSSTWLPSLKGKSISSFSKVYSAPILFLTFFSPKKREREICVSHFYGLFLKVVIMSAPTMATAIIIATPMPMMYICVGSKLTGCIIEVGAVVAA